MPKTKVPRKEAKAISERLKALAKRGYGSISRFQRELGVPRTTGIAWFGGRHPSTPEVPFLLRFARESNVSLDWLLLGEGPEYRQRPTFTGRGHVLAAIEARLRATETASEREFKEVWNRLVIYQRTRSGDDAILELATEGVRPLFRELLSQVRMYDELIRFAENWSAAFLRAEQIEPEESRKRLAEFLGTLQELMESRKPALSVAPPRIVELEPRQK